MTAEPEQVSYTPPAVDYAAPLVVFEETETETPPARAATVERQPEERVSRTEVETPPPPAPPKAPEPEDDPNKPKKSGWWQRKSFF
jgi:ribonuclease E